MRTYNKTSNGFLLFPVFLLGILLSSVLFFTLQQYLSMQDIFRHSFGELKTFYLAQSGLIYLNAYRDRIPETFIPASKKRLYSTRPDTPQLDGLDGTCYLLKSKNKFLSIAVSTQGYRQIQSAQYTPSSNQLSHWKRH